MLPHLPHHILEDLVIAQRVSAEKHKRKVEVHDALHRLRETSPEAYTALADFVQANLSEESTAFNLSKRAELYETGDVDVLTEETVADAFGQMLEKSDVLAQFATEHRSAARKLMDALHDLVVKIKRALNGGEVRLSDNQRAAFRDLADKVGKMESLFSEALETTKGKENAANEGGAAKFSIKETKDGKKYVKADRQVIFGNDPQSWSEQLEDYINGKIRRGQDVFLTAADGDILTLTATSAGKLSDTHTSDGRTMSEATFERKANAASHIDELAQVSTRGKKSVRDHDNRHGSMATDGWNYRTAYFEDFDGTYYEVTISVAENADGKMIYNIGQMKKRNSPQINGSSVDNNGALRGTASNENVAQNSSDVNGKFSLKTIDEMEQSLNAMNEEYRGLEKRNAEFQAAPEYLALMDAIGDARASKKSLLDKPEALSKALDSYSEWQEKSGYSEVIHRMEDLRGEMKTLRGKLESAKKQAAQEEKTAMRAGYNDSMAKNYAAKSARKFGTTSNFDLAGYLTVNGTLLDFSDGQGYRVRDHREITDVLDFLPTDHGYSDGMVEFMNLGNIRLQSYGIDISKAPNTAQRAMLRKFFLSKNGDVTVDFSDENGRSVGSLEYDRGTSADRILNDIDTYFRNGSIPDQSVVSQFHGKYSLKGAENARELAALRRENEKLKERVEYWKGQTRRSSGVTTDKKSVEKAAKALVRDYGAAPFALSPIVVKQ